MKVLLVLEDPTHDRYVVEPVVRRILDDLGLVARLDVLLDPHLRGVDDLFGQLPDILADNRMVDLFVVVVDRDCNRRNNVERLRDVVGRHGKLAACCAIEEVESWMLVLHRDALGAPWPVVRADCDVKEHYAEEFLRSRGEAGPGRGRKAAMRTLGSGWRGLLDLCDEVAGLRETIRQLAAPERG